MIINKNIPIPLYYQLKQLILTDITEGVYKDGDLIPTEMELIEKYEVSRTTVRQAINDLVYEGYLTRKKGVGTFVCTPSEYINNQENYNISFQIKKNGYKLKTQLLNLARAKADKQVAEILKIKPTEDIFIMERLRYGNEVPVTFSRTHVACALVPNLEVEVNDAYVAWHDYLKKNGREVKTIERTLEAGIADKATSDLLQLQNKNASIMIQTDICFSQESKPIEYTISTINSRLLKLTSRFNVSK